MQMNMFLREIIVYHSADRQAEVLQAADSVERETDES